MEPPTKANSMDVRNSPTGRTSQDHTRDLFAWHKQIIADKTLTDADFKVAYVIGDHINRDTGAAWPSTARLAEQCSKSQPSVVRIIRQLEAAGHLAIESGKAGRGHSHRYRLVLKHPSMDVLPGGKHPSMDGKHPSVTPKTSTGGYEPLKEQLNNQRDARTRVDPAELVKNMKGWEAKQINKLLDRVVQQDKIAPPNESIFDKVARLERICQNQPSVVASCNLDIAWLEAEQAGLACYPDEPKSIYEERAKPYWLDTFNGTTIDHAPLRLIAASS